MKYGALEMIEEKRVADLILLLQEVNLLGREFGDFLIEDEEASAEHCQIQKIGTAYHLIDLGSTNGTFLNEKKVVKSILQEGDLVRIGKIQMRFTEMELESSPDPREILASFLLSKPAPLGRSAALIDQISEIRGKVLGKSRLVLDVIYEDGSRQVLKFSTGRVDLGRQTERGKFKDDQELSKEHVTLRIAPEGEIVVRDQGSTNGTFVNEKRLTGECKVVPGDMIRIGRTRIWCRPEIQ